MNRQVRHINFSRRGGAGSVASTLAAAQRQAGWDSSVLYVIDGTLRSQPFASPLHTLAAGTDEYLLKAGGFNSSLSSARDMVRTSIIDQIPQGSIVHLHGTNGTVSLQEIRRLSQTHTVVWTLHDMNPFTGGCHYSLGCAGFEQKCAACPAVRPPFRSLITKNLKAKATMWEAHSSIRLVAPTHWLADSAGSSSVLGGQHIHVIPNPLAPEFEQVPVATPSQRGDGEDRLVVGVVAADLSDPVKNIAEAVTAFTQARDTNARLELRLVGARGDEHSYAGDLQGVLNANELRSFYSQCDVLIMPSLAENGPLVIAEAGSQGCKTYARNTGGNGEMIQLAGGGSTYSEVSELVSLLVHLEPASSKKRAVLQGTVRSVFGSSTIAGQYTEVYRSGSPGDE